jgi:hypothetical protein
MNVEEQIKLADGVNYQSFGADEDGVMLSLQSGYLYRCNPAAIQLLDRLRAGASLSELQYALSDEFDVPAEQAREDAWSFVEQLLAESLAHRTAA